MGEPWDENNGCQVVKGKREGLLLLVLGLRPEPWTFQAFLLSL